MPHIQSSKKSVEEELIFNAEEGLKNKMENFILKKIFKVYSHIWHIFIAKEAFRKSTKICMFFGCEN